VAAGVPADERDALLALTPDELRAVRAQFDPLDWTLQVANVQLPKGAHLDFHRYPYMRDVYRDRHPDIVIIKGAQLGFSTWAICRTGWAVTTFNMTVIYTFPTRELVSEYTASRINPIIEMTPYLKDRIIDVNSVRLKQFRRDPHDRKKGVSIVHFQGAAKESDALSVDADLLVHDEEDKSNSQVISQYVERLTASRFKWRIRLSTPTIPGKGVDRGYRDTDQMKWLVTCHGCALEFELRFPKEPGDPRGNVEPDTFHEVVGGAIPRYRCHRCNTTVSDDDRRAGRWVAKRTTTGLPRGYQVSQMSAPWVSAYDLLKAKSEQQFEKDFWNLKIGIAWQSGVTAMTRQALEERQGDYSLQTIGDGTFMGVDVGAKLHVLIEDFDEDGRVRVRAIMELDWDPGRDFEELDEVMRDFGVSVCVIDREPETGMARRFARRWNGPGHARVYLAKYKDETANASSREIRFDAPDDLVNRTEDVAAVKAPRNELLTMVANELLTQIVLPHFDGSQPIEDFLEHCWNSKRVPVYKDDASAIKEIDHYEWENTGPDHYFHALVYAKLARMAPRPLAAPIRGIISASRGGRAHPILPGEDEDMTNPNWRPPIRRQRVG
jgi:hypothetical protein